MMIKLTVTENEGNQRLDRFLKKYLHGAPLSFLYRAIRKDVKVNGKRAEAQDKLLPGDEITLYLPEEVVEGWRKKTRTSKAKRQFTIALEDENLLIAVKPFGLLTHGDRTEKRNTLANQVIDYLIETGAFQLGGARTFVPSPVNRLDRNTTGLVIFGKNYQALQDLNHMIREKEFIRKYYLTIVAGRLTRELELVDKMQKDPATNQVRVLDESESGGKQMETVARPLKSAGGYTLTEVELVTGRTHQIRAHLAKAGYPVIGDQKYGKKQINAVIAKKYGLTTQFLHAYLLYFSSGFGSLEYLAGATVKAPLPPNMEAIRSAMFGAAERD